MKYLISILSILVLTSCASSLLPQKRTESVQATESIANAQNLMIEKVTTSGLQGSGQPFQETISLSHDSSAIAGAQEDVASSLSTPVMVSIAIGCAGIGVLLVAWILFSRLTSLGRAADSGLGAVANSIQSIVASTSDADENSMISL